MRKQKTGAGNGSRKKDFFPKLFSLAVILAIIIVVCLGLVHLFKNLDYFKVKDIAVIGQDKNDFAYLKGRNIFTVDLVEEARQIAFRYPGYKRVVLVRILPDKIFVAFFKRTPVAFVKLSRPFLVDNEAVLLETRDTPETLALPVITGLERKLGRPLGGSRYNIKELSLALDILRNVRQNNALKNIPLKEISVPNPQQAAFFILDGLEVKVGADNIRERIALLVNLLKQSKTDLLNIEYVDLRFKEPVIKFKDEKKNAKK